MQESSSLPTGGACTQGPRGLAPGGPHIWPSAELLHGFEAAGLSLWIWNVDDDSFTMDERGFRLWGLDWKEQLTFEDLSKRIHPADRDRVRAAFAAFIVDEHRASARVPANPAEHRWGR